MPTEITKLRLGATAAAILAIVGSGLVMQRASQAPDGAVERSASVAAQTPAAGGVEADQRLARLAPTRDVAAPGELTLPEPGARLALGAPEVPEVPQLVTRGESRPPLVLSAPSALPEAAGEGLTGPLQLAAAGEPRLEQPGALAAPRPGRPGPASCETGFTAYAAPGAMVDLTLESPCHAGETADFFHAGLRFTERFDEAGVIEVSVPALSEEATFSALLADGTSYRTDVLMLTASDYTRTALEWQGDAGFELHAFEDGATWEAAGHVWPQNPQDADRARAGEGGFLTALGSVPAGQHVMVYSWPARLADSGHAVELEVELQITAGNCGKESHARLWRTGEGGLQEVPISLAPAGCNALGDYLVLKNLPQLAKLAQTD